MSKTILVVDDSPTILKFVSFSLRNSGFDVVSSSDGMDAVEKLSATRESVAMIITDLNMPNMDGYNFIQTLRQNLEHAHTPIIILSAEESPDDMARGMTAGANSYLVKPFRSDRLLQEVRRFLKVTVR